MKHTKPKRSSAAIDIGRDNHGNGHTQIFYAPVRVLGTNKATGKVWIKSRYQTQLIDASELVTP